MFTNGREPFGTPGLGGERWPISVLTRAPKREEARMNPIVTNTMRLVRISLRREVASFSRSYKLRRERMLRRERTIVFFGRRGVSMLTGLWRRVLQVSCMRYLRTLAMP